MGGLLLQLGNLLIAVLGGFVDHLKVPISEAVEVAFQVRVKGLEVVLCDDLFS